MKAHVRQMTNSLDLDSEWGAIDLLEEVAATFGLKIADEEAERCATVGDLYDILCTRLPDWDDQDGSCASSIVFYRLRRSLSPTDKRAVVPGTPLTASGSSPLRLFKKLADGTGLRLPSCKLTSLGVVGGFLLLGGIIGVVVALFNGHWIVSAAFALIALVGTILLRVDPGRFPTGIFTVADLVRRTAPLNVAYIKEVGGRPADRWSILVALAAEHGSLSPDHIGPDTVFHGRNLDQAKAG